MQLTHFFLVAIKILITVALKVFPIKIIPIIAPHFKFPKIITTIHVQSTYMGVIKYNKTGSVIDILVPIISGRKKTRVRDTELLVLSVKRCS